MWKPFYLCADGYDPEEVRALEDRYTAMLESDAWLKNFDIARHTQMLLSEKARAVSEELRPRVDAIGHKAVIQRMVEIHGPITSLPPIWLVEMAVLSLETRSPNPKPDHSPE